ncbi:hypothetical protein [Methylorubrum extorquens]|uniref:hypothetical protein n=1 Tax=Methylorubrum extorquens TaxID=408 RepID=UPI00209CA045|nr:hypothetical protein [Methylorubrum extorquens]MCP1540041.1 hypothetical protein [Methylorubrum extorquens]
MMLASSFQGIAARRFNGSRFALSGAALGYCEARGRLLVEKRFDMLEGRAGGAPRFDLRLRVEKILKGETARGSAHVYAEMSPRVFDGVMTGKSTVASQLLVRKNLRTWAAGQAEGAATIHIAKELTATARGIPSADVRLTVEKILGAPTVHGYASVAANPLIEKLFVTRAAGHAAAVATMRTEKLLGALSDGSAHTLATLLTEKQLTGSAHALSAPAGALTVAKLLVAATSGQGLMTGDERIRKQLTGTASSLAIVSATMEPPITYRRTQSDDIRETQSGDVRQTERDVN